MRNAPLPGRPVRGSASGRPLMAALDLLGRRWALRVLWELRDGPVGARELRDRCDQMSTSVLYERLRELTAAGLVQRGDGDRYELTMQGRSLRTAIEPLNAWAKRWAEGRALPTGVCLGQTGTTAGGLPLRPSAVDRRRPTRGR